LRRTPSASAPDGGRIFMGVAPYLLVCFGALLEALAGFGAPVVR
jgi:L-lactate permease